MSKFDYAAPAELFCQKRPRKAASFYLRFDTAAAAIRYAVEELDPVDRQMTIVEVDEQRLDRRAIQELYESGDYPLARTERGTLQS